jgi:tetratricopeptide (TPR) repeat protein
MRHILAATFHLIVALALPAPTAGAQPALLDSLRPAIERAVAHGDWASLDAAATRLRAATAGPGARDPWTHYDLGYVLHRRASVLLIAKRTEEAKPLLEESERALARAQSLGGGATATALRGAVTGQLAGAGGALNAMRMGPRSFKLLDEAIAAAPRDPRVALLNGMSRLNAPRAFGGGPAKGEPELRRAIALFASDAPTAQSPNWGRADAHIWLGIALERLGRRDEARVELQRALALTPAHAWVTRELLPRLDAAR